MVESETTDLCMNKAEGKNVSDLEGFTDLRFLSKVPPRRFLSRARPRPVHDDYSGLNTPERVLILSDVAFARLSFDHSPSRPKWRSLARLGPASLRLCPPCHALDCVTGWRVPRRIESVGGRVRGGSVSRGEFRRDAIARGGDSPYTRLTSRLIFADSDCASQNTVENELTMRVPPSGGERMRGARWDSPV